MPEQSVADRFKEVVARQLCVNLDQVVSEAKLVEDLGADSFDTVELVMKVEEIFGIEIPDDDAETLTTVGQAVAYIEGHSNGEKAPDKLPATIQAVIAVVKEMNQDRVIAVIAKLFKVDPKSVNRETRFEEDLNGDEFDFLTLASDLEKEFGLQKNDVDEGLLANCKTVGGAIDYFELVLRACAR